MLCFWWPKFLLPKPHNQKKKKSYMQTSLNEVNLAQRWFLKGVLCSGSISFHSDGEQEVLWQAGSLSQLKPFFPHFFLLYSPLKLELYSRLNTPKIFSKCSRHTNHIEEWNNHLKSNPPPSMRNALRCHSQLNFDKWCWCYLFWMACVDGPS